MGTSKLKIGRPVPESVATVTTTVRENSGNAIERHASVVGDIHDDDEHKPRSLPTCPSPAVAVCSPMPKLRPETVIEASPLCGAFSRTSETKAASKLIIGRPVPDIDPTVTVADTNMSEIALERHERAVADVHDEVGQTKPRSPLPPRSSANVAVSSPTPKLRPDTVKDAYPLCGVFSRTPESTETSRLYTACPVPATDPTVS
jgi:hypothetical protein